MAHPSTTDSGGQTTQITAGFNNIVISWTRTLKIIRNDTLHGFLPFSGFQLWGRVPRDEEECSHWVHVTQGCKGDHRVQYTSHVQPLPPRQTQPLLPLPTAQHLLQDLAVSQCSSCYSQKMKSQSTKKAFTMMHCYFTGCTRFSWKKGCVVTALFWFLYVRLQKDIIKTHNSSISRGNFS